MGFLKPNCFRKRNSLARNDATEVMMLHFFGCKGIRDLNILPRPQPEGCGLDIQKEISPPVQVTNPNSSQPGSSSHDVKIPRYSKTWVLLQNWIPQNPISGSHWLLMFPKKWPSIGCGQASPLLRAHYLAPSSAQSLELLKKMRWCQAPPMTS